MQLQGKSVLLCVTARIRMKQEKYLMIQNKIENLKLKKKV